MSPLLAEDHTGRAAALCFATGPWLTGVLPFPGIDSRSRPWFTVSSLRPLPISLQHLPLIQSLQQALFVATPTTRVDNEASVRSWGGSPHGGIRPGDSRQT